MIEEQKIPKDGSCRLELNLKPGLTPEQLDKRIQRDCTAHPNQAMGTIFRGLLPLKLVPVFLEAVHIPPETKANALTKEQRRILVQGLQAFPLHITARFLFGKYRRKPWHPNAVRACILPEKCWMWMHTPGDLIYRLPFPLPLVQQMPLAVYENDFVPEKLPA